ncbi:MAG: hypothetical protein OXE46_04660 [Chloroflexi bacterium]|nr:hypothetical protein [Chloroflexota bacterium]
MTAIIEVVVGLVFVIILLSIVVTEVNTLFARATKMRARNLRGAINSLIADPVIRAKLYTHPLIQLVKADAVAPSQRITRAEAEKTARRPIASVDYIEPATFVDVVLTTVKAESDQRLFGALINVVDGMPPGPERRGLRVMVQRVVRGGQDTKELRNSLRYVQDRRYRAALADIVSQIDEEISRLGAGQTNHVALLAGVRQVEDDQLRNVLATVLSGAENMQEARGNLEGWFNSAMNRASAAYTAKMKVLSLIVALCFALLINIDTLHIAQTLWEDPAQRAQISGTATYSLQSGALGDQVGEADDELRANDAEGDTQLEDAVESGAAIVNQLGDLEALSLPIGWGFQSLAHLPADHYSRSDPSNLWNYLPENNPDGWTGLLLTKLLGIAATVVAAAQGAPFWFGIVNKVVRR